MTIPLRTFVRKSVPAATFIANGVPSSLISNSPFSDIDKHTKLSYDGVRRVMVTNGGDVASSGGHELMFKYNVATNAWSFLSTTCHAPGKITPSPGNTDDAPPLIIDHNRNRYVSWAGVTTTNGGPPNTTCNTDWPGHGGGSTFKFGIVALNPDTGDWTTLRDDSSIFPSTDYPPLGYFAFWDPVGDVYIGVNNNDEELKFVSPTSFAVTKLSTNQRFLHPSGSGDLVSNPVPMGDGNVWWQNTVSAVPAFAPDILGRRLYFMAVSSVGPSPGSSTYTIPRFMFMNLDTGQVGYLPHPPVPTGVSASIAPGGNAPWLLFDTKNRALIYIDIRNTSGVVKTGVYVYPLATGVWEFYPTTQDITPGNPAGNCWAYNPDENVCVGGGTVFWTDNGEVFPGFHCWHWRYA